MLQMIHNNVQVRTVLRCFWVPSHTGVNAPLQAVWVETPEAEMEQEAPTSVPVDEPPLLSRAA